MTILDDAKDGMDPAIRPQDDLFGHVNGRWLETVEIPPDRSGWGSFMELAETAEQQVRDIVEELAGADPEPGSNARKIGDLYASFMDEERAERLGAEPIRADLAQLAAVASKDELVAFVARLERDGGAGFFGAYVKPDDKNSERYLLNIAQGGLG